MIKTEEEQRKTRIKNPKAARLVVRNLPFRCNEESVKEHFSPYGEVNEVALLRKNGKLTGCGFIQYDKLNSAAKAIAKLSGREFMGRPIIVDWAIPKDKFIKKIKKDYSGPGNENVIIKEENESEDEDSKDFHEKLPVKVKKEDEMEIKEEERTESEDDENVGSESDEEEESLIVTKKRKVTQERNDTDRKTIKKGKHFQYDPNDVSDGRTIFLKNVPFSADNDILEDCVSEAGPIVYSVVCVDHLTEHSRGTAFVKYQNKRDAEAVLNGEKKLIIKGEILEPHLALKKEQIQNKESNKNLPKDNRNLYLLREGIILANSPAAEGVSNGDMVKRLQLEQRKTQTLRNLNKFVSPTRLVVHNIPLGISDKKLLQIFKENSSKSAFIKEARIMRNLKDVNEKGEGRSKGFGFIEFTKHEDALTALRKINNNPTIFTDKKRPIVAFSIEDRVALKIKEKRKTIAKENPNKKRKSTEKKPTVVNSEGGEAPKFCGYTAKPGTKTLRTKKELNRQAEMHHEEMQKKKKEKKFNAFRKRNRKQRGEKKMNK